MTKDELAAIKARCWRATYGPWEICGQGDERFEFYSVDNASFPIAADCLKFDAEFIAHARSDVPALVAEVEKLRECLMWIYRGGAEDGYDLDGKKVGQKIREALGKE